MAPTWTTALPDWEERIVQGRSLLPCGPLFPEEADAAMDVFLSLRLVDVAGSPTIGESSLPWLVDFARVVFGSYDAVSGRRLIKDYFLLVSKKNAKSTIAAGIMLTALILNWRLSAELTILAPTMEIAKNAFKPARDMVKADPELDAAAGGFLQVQDHLKTITHLGTGACLKVVAADAETVGGKKSSIVLVDELWLFGKRENAENMLIEATGGLASRPEGFVMYLTTQSDEPPAGVFKQKLDLYRDIRDGKIIKPRSLGVLYEFPKAIVEARTYFEPGNWHVTNPNLGLSVDVEYIADKLEEARISGEASLRNIAAKHLNVEIGLALRSDRWAGADHWEKRADKTVTFESLLQEADVVTIGIDGGGLDDLLGLAVMGRHKQTRGWQLWTRAWMHQGVLERRKGEASRLRDFERDGDLVIVDDMLSAYVDLADLVEQVNDAGLLAKVGLDPVGVALIVDELSQRGISDATEQVVGVSQGYKLTGSIKTLEVKLSDGQCRHAGQPLMNWCVANARTVATGNALLITKAVSGSGKIDPLMASFNATALMAMNPEPIGGQSKYETEDLLVL